MKILLVDDDPNALGVLADVMQLKGMEAVAVTNGAAALKQTATGDFDVALVDLKLGDMSGLDVLRSIQACSCETESILLTGYASQASAIEAVNLGAYAYFQKPYEMEQLLLAIRRAGERRTARLALQESEARLRSVLENSPDTIYITDLAESKALFCNRELFCGYSRDELEAPGSILYRVHPDDRPALSDFWNQARTGVVSEPVEFRLFQKDDSLVWLCQRYSVFRRNPDGTPKELLVTTREITARKEAENAQNRLLQQVQEQAQQMTQLLEAVPEGVLLLDSDGRILLSNPVAQHDLSFLLPLQVDEEITHLGGRPLVEFLTSPPKGRWHELQVGSRHLEIIARPIVNGLDREQWVMVIDDVTQSNLVHAQLQQQERLAAVGQMAAGIAHDFNNIMGVIILQMQILDHSSALADRDRQRLHTVSDQAYHATALIRQVLDFSRRSVLERQNMDLLQLVKEQVKLLERTLPESIQVEMTYDRGTFAVHADPTRIQQVMMNLAINAADAMPAGGMLRIGLDKSSSLPVSLSASATAATTAVPTAEWVRLTVSDTGEGIPAEVLPHIYDPFFTTKQPGRGTGLGLAQVYGIISQHDGFIAVETAEGEGTTFAIYLPTLVQEDAAVPVAQAGELFTGKGELLLVVEDNAPLRAALVEILHSLDYTVAEAGNGQEALDVLAGKDGAVALVLSDVVMPKMGGIALVHTLRERGWRKPVIFLTGHPLEANPEMAQGQDVWAWLPKPPDIAKLAQSIAEALRGEAAGEAAGEAVE